MKICLLCLLLFFPLGAEETLPEPSLYERTLAHPLIREQEGHLLVSLSDGTLWKWEPQGQIETLLDHWEVGDLIWLRAPLSGGVQLYNRTHCRFSPLVFPAEKTLSLIPTLIELSTDGKYFMLSDGSEWQLQLEFQVRAVRLWEIGDHILPTPCGLKEGSLHLLNIDLPYDPHFPDARQVCVDLLFKP